MSRIARAALGIALAATALAPRSASAQVCGGSLFQTCASVGVTAQDIGGGVTEIVLTVTNWSGFGGTYAGTIFTSMGLMGLPNFSYVAGSLSVSGPGSWSLGTPGLNGSGIVLQTAGVNPNGGLTNGLAAGQTATFTFRITGFDAATALAHADDWAIHGQGGPNNCSTKLVVTDGVPNSGSDPACVLPGGPGTASVTPEPMSVLLVGTGLVGIVGAGARRRRRV